MAIVRSSGRGFISSLQWSRASIIAAYPESICRAGGLFFPNGVVQAHKDVHNLKRPILPETCSGNFKRFSPIVCIQNIVLSVLSSTILGYFRTFTWSGCMQVMTDNSGDKTSLCGGSCYVRLRNFSAFVLEKLGRKRKQKEKDLIYNMGSMLY